MKRDHTQSGFIARRVAALVLAIVALATTVVTACPNCKEAVADQDPTGLAAGLSYTVIGMASMPFLLVGAVAAILVRAHRRRQRGIAEIDMQE